MIEDEINQDLKKAMLNREEIVVSTLRGLKSSIQYATVDASSKVLGEDEILKVLQKEAKKRQEAADLYIEGENNALAEKELKEKIIIEKYLPDQMSANEISKLVDTVIQEAGGLSRKNIGQLIGKAKQKAGASAEGSAIANEIQKRLRDKQ